MSDATIAITGAGGFVGSRLLKRMQDAHPDWEFVAFDNFQTGEIHSVGDVDVREVDIRDRANLDDSLRDSDLVVHLAAISGVDDCESMPELAYEVNLQGTANVAWYCRRSGAAMIFPFSMAVLGDPTSFPVTVDHPRDPMNWYGRTKLIGERLVADLAAGAFPAHCFLKSNLYGSHTVDGTRVSKGTVVNFFVDRAKSGDPLTVYAPGTQARNYVHVDDVARAYVASAERLLDRRRAGATGVTRYEIASDDSPSVMTIARTVQRYAREHRNIEVPIQTVDNPRDETLVDRFEVNIERAREELGWSPERGLEETIRSALAGDSDG